MAVIENMVNDIEKRLYNSMEKEITSKYIGENVMNELIKVDEVAYVRFASVYRQFKDLNTFMDELKRYWIRKNNTAFGGVQYGFHRKIL